MFKHGQTGPAVTPMFDEDALLVAVTQAGNAAASAQLVFRYDRKLFRIANHIVRNVDDAQDVVEDSFIKAFKNIRQFETAFELLLKAVCQHFGLSVKFHPDARKVPASDLWSALKSAKSDFIPARQCAFDDKGKVHWWQPPVTQIPVVRPALQKRIEHAVSWILNPFDSFTKCRSIPR
jgi:hypothetical protein